MLRLTGVVCTAVYVTVLCSHSAWLFSLRDKPRNHQPGRCTQVKDIDGGAFDIQVLPRGLAFLTSRTEPTGRRGHICLFDFKKHSRGVQALDIVGDFNRTTFSPTGLNIWRDPSRKLIYIFVVNFLGNKPEHVEKFRFDEKTQTLTHIRTYQDPTFIGLLDIVVTGEDSFYFVNFYEFNWLLEFSFGVRVGNVGFYDGARGRVILTKLGVPVGINASPDGKYVYLAEIGGKSVKVYKRKSDNSLMLRQVVPMCSLVELINVDESTGDLWVAGHGNAYLLLKYLLIPPHTTVSPSRVFRLKMSEGGAAVTVVEEVYYNDGRQISGSSVAVHYGGHMLIGSAYTNMLLCEA